ncbi:MAG: undecaprenyldiphospho-muramoylpentapeptide beta-N-acetylglucosaminyltransferase [Magnetospiraceae bacterium]
MSGPLILLAAGGTGGHVFPAEALAESLLARGCRLALVTDKRGSAYGGRLGAMDTYRIRAGGIAGRSLINRLRAMVDLGLGVVQAFLLLARLRPAAVVGFGGYASFPTVKAATLRKVPTVIHEQNAVLGRANRMLAKSVSRVALAFPETKFAPADAAKVQHVGMPVRPAILAAREAAYAAPEPGQPLRILVMGGSQGAAVFSAIVPQAVALLPEGQQQRLHISQQCRPEDLDKVTSDYAALSATTELRTFFEDVPDRLAAAHLVITRSGASSLAEVMVVGRPSILVPYPYAIDDHQTANARALGAAGGAWLLSGDAFTAQALADYLTQFLAQPETLAATAAVARGAGVPDAAGRLADCVLETMGGQGS